MGALDWLNQNFLQPGEAALGQSASNAKQAILNSVSNFDHGTTGWQQAAQGYLNQNVGQPVANQVSPTGSGAVGSAIDYLNGRIVQGNLLPTVPGPSQQFSQDHPVEGFLGGLAAGAVNMVPQTLNEGVISPTADVSNEVSNYAGGGTGLSYNQLVSGAGRLGAQIGGATGAPQDAGHYVQNIAQTANPIVNAAFLGHAVGGVAESTLPLWQRVLGSGAENAALGAGAGLVSGVAGSQDTSGPGLWKSAGKGALGGAETGALLGSVSPVAGDAFRYSTDAIQNAKDYPHLANATHTFQAPIPQVESSVKGVPVTMNGETVMSPHPDITTRELPESYAGQVLRGRADPRTPTINEIGAKDQGTVPVSFNNKTGKIVSWGDENTDPAFVNSIHQAAGQGAAWQTTQPGFVRTGSGEVPQGPKGSVKDISQEEPVKAPTQYPGKGIAQEFAGNILPNALGKDAVDTSYEVRNAKAAVANTASIEAYRNEPTAKFFDKQGSDANIGNISEYERTGKFATEPSPGYSEKYAQDMANSRKAISDFYGEDKVGLVDNYVRRAFKFGSAADEARGTTALENYQKSLAGSKSPLKGRVLDMPLDAALKDMRDRGIKVEPATTNPELLRQWSVLNGQKLAKYGEMWQNLKESGNLTFVPSGKVADPGMVRLNDQAAKTFAPYEYNKANGETGTGVKQSGQYYATPGAAKVLNNAVSSGLENSPTYQGIKSLSNSLNQFQLGFSGFHAMGSSVNAGVSDLAVGAKNIGTGIARGDAGTLATGAGQVARSLVPFFSVGHDIMTGSDIINGLKEGNPEAAKFLQEKLNPAGGRLGMDQNYVNGSYRNMVQSFSDGNLLGAAMKLPKAIVEETAKPLMGYAIPRIKLGAFSDLADSIDRQMPGASPAEKQAAYSRAWDSIDNRFGQLVYDNLFWNKTAKDLSMIATRSVGWNLGTVRELGGGAKDVLGTLQGKGISDRMLYSAALPLYVGMIGAAYQYLHTGQGPQSLLDYFYPKNGAVDKNGNPQRTTLPTYMKDVFAYGRNPVGTVVNKTSPLMNLVSSLYSNKDYYGDMIRNPNDPLAKQLQDSGMYALKNGVLPFSVSGAQNTASNGGNLEQQAENFVGFVKAPSTIDPNSPTGKYVGAITQATQGMDQNTLAQWKSIHPTNTAGSPKPQYNYDQTPQKFYTYINNPAVFQADRQISQAIGDSNPMYSLQGNALKAYLSLKAQPGATSDQKAIWNAQLPPDFYDRYDAYIKGLQDKGVIPAGTASQITTAQKDDALNLLPLPDSSNPALRASKYSTFLEPNSDGSLSLSDGWKARQQLAIQNNGKPDTYPRAAPGSTLGVEPLYKLPDNEAAQVIWARSVNALDPGEAHLLPTVTAIKAQPFYKNLQAAESTYYNEHPITASATPGKGAAQPYPNMPANLSDYAKQIAAQPTPAAKAALYNTPMGKALDSYYSTLDQYNTQQTAQLIRTPISVPATKYAPGYVASPVGSPAPGTPSGTLAGAPVQPGVQPISVAPASSGSSGSGSSVSKALATSSAHRNARKVLASMSKSHGGSGRVKAPTFKQVSVKAHVRNIPVSPVTEPKPRPVGKVRRPSPKLA
jgi:hypothetical protein